ncbi:Methyl-accepting chemotaxis protein McpQ [Pseudomonas brassicacearum]|nr:methyl-accepting chemotaxis protein [Pseudomonas brassicacearum]CAH0156775.1 Methyl-accepting chemotaxis protein McpQ [Pseudomonas brassicacearum]
MIRYVISGFANLAVGKKLGIGFGLVLLLTVAVIGAGFSAVGVVMRGQLHVSRLQAIEAKLLTTRLSERAFAMITNDGNAATTRLNINEVQTLLTQHLADSPPSGKQALQRVEESTELYRTYFERFVDQQSLASEARAKMSDAAREAGDQFETVEISMYDAVREQRVSNESTANNDPLTLAETASALSKQMLELRQNESHYIIDGTDAAFQNWTSVSHILQSSSVALSELLADDMRNTMGNALYALTQYQQAFAIYNQALQESRRFEALLIMQAETVSALVEGAKSATIKTMTHEAKKTLLVLGAMGTAAVIMGIIGALLISRSIVGPLRRTVTFARLIAAGDLSQNLNIDRRDEVGHLSMAIQEMNLSLRKLVTRIDSGVSQIASAADQLSSSAAQTNADVHAQKLESERTADAMQLMSEAIAGVSNNSTSALNAAKSASLEAQHGNDVVQNTVEQISALARQIEVSASAIRSLSEESGKISGVLEVIRGVAEQTNLLALNAAIEAARAGEQGRGFAVVADEVRALAQRAHNSTKEIESLTASLQRMAGDAIEQMENSRLLTHSSVALTTRAGEALTVIAKSVSTIEQMNIRIEAAARVQNETVDGISQSVESVRTIAERSASVSDQTAGYSLELARLGLELQLQVKQFRT